MNCADQYREEAERFGKADLLLSVIVYLILCVMLFLLGRYFYFQKLESANASFYMLEFIQGYFVIGIIALVCRWRKQSVSQVFFSKEGFGRSCAMGLVCAGILLAFTLVKGKGHMNYEFGKAVERFLYFFVIVAIPEEVVFRGYMGKRFYGAISNRFIAVAAVAFLFALEHIPFQAAIRGMSLAEYCALNWKSLISISAFHVIFHWMTVKYHNIAMPVIVHCAWDFLRELFV